jgi:hypothetical protein
MIADAGERKADIRRRDGSGHLRVSEFSARERTPISRLNFGVPQRGAETATLRMKGMRPL